MYDKRLNLLCRKSKNLPFESALGYNICITAKLYDQNYNMISKHFLIKYATVSEINATKQEIEALGPTDKRIDDIFLMSIEYYDENDVTLSLSEELRGIIYDIVYDSETNTIFLYGSNMDKLISVQYTDKDTTKSNTKVERVVNKILTKQITLNLKNENAFSNDENNTVCPYYGIAKMLIEESKTPLIYCYDENGRDVLIGKFVPIYMYLTFMKGFIIYRKEDEELVDRVDNNILSRSKNYEVLMDTCGNSIFIRKPKEIKENIVIEHKDDIVVLPKIHPNTLTKIIMSTNQYHYLTCDLSYIDNYNISDIKADIDTLNDTTQQNKYCLPIVMKLSDGDYVIMGKAFSYSPYIPETPSIKEWGIKIQCAMFWMMFGDNDENLLKEVINDFSGDERKFEADVKLLVDKDGNHSGINNLGFLENDSDTLTAFIIEFPQ